MKGWRRRSRASVVRAGAAGAAEGVAEGVQRAVTDRGQRHRIGRGEFAIGRTQRAIQQYDSREVWQRGSAGAPRRSGRVCGALKMVNPAGWNGLTE